MAVRAATVRLPRLFRTAMEKFARAKPRYFSDDKGRILSEEERAAENVYIQVRTAPTEQLVQFASFLAFDSSGRALVV